MATVNSQLKWMVRRAPIAMWLKSGQWNSFRSSIWRSAYDLISGPSWSLKSETRYYGKSCQLTIAHKSYHYHSLHGEPGANKSFCCMHDHYSDIIMSMMASHITSFTIVYSIIYSGTDQRNIKALRQWPLCREFTGDRWIPHAKGQ